MSDPINTFMSKTGAEFYISKLLISSMSYDFNKRDDFDYQHSYDYFGGVGLGKAEHDAEIARKAKLGTYDLVPVAPPVDEQLRLEIVRVAALVNKSAQRESLLAKVAQAKDKRMEFVWNKQHSGHAYFVWALHCLDREVVDWELIRPSSGVEATTSRSQPAVVPVNKGDRVEVTDLKARPELNGKVGTVVGEANNRWLVEFSDIAQTISLPKDKCAKTSRSEPQASSERLPLGLRVEVMKLQSEQGKAMNGMEGFVTGFSSESQRYTVRLELTGELKSLKRENLHIVLPPGIEERIDEASGQPYYLTLASGAVSWRHPILGNRKKKSEFVNPESGDEATETPAAGEFDRDEFLEQERKRLRLDKKRQGVTDEKVEDALLLLRERLEIGPKSASPLFVGSAAALLSQLDTAHESERTKYLFVGLQVLFADFKQLKFNKRQLTGLLERVDEICESRSVSPALEDWIRGGLKVAMPGTYTVH